MKNSSDTIGNRTRDPPTRSAVPQPNALPRAPFKMGNIYKYYYEDHHRIWAGIAQSV